MPDTMTINGITANVVYLDASATYNGDGSSPDGATGPSGPGAMNTLPAPIAWPNNTVYMMRRVSNVLTLQAGNFNGSGVKNLWLLGAPRDTDDLYYGCPAAIKSGGNDWCHESADYATVKVASNYDSHIFYGYNFGMSRIDFRFRTEESGTNVYVWDLNNTSDVTGLANHFFTHMKIWVDGYDISSDVFTTNFTNDMPPFITSAFNGDGNFVFKHNIIMHVYRTYANWDWIYVNSMRNVVVSDCMVYCACYETFNYTNSIFNVTAGERLRVSDINMQHIVQNFTDVGLNYLGYFTGNGTSTIKNIDISVRRRYPGSAFRYRMLNGGLSINTSFACQIENINVDLTGLGNDFANYVYNYGIYITCSSGMAGYISTAESYIRNLSVKIPDSSANPNWQNYGNAVYMPTLPPAIGKIDGLVSYHKRGTGLYLDNTSVWSCGLVFSNADIKGIISVSGVTLHIPGTWECDTIGNGILDLQRATVYINNAVLPITWGTQWFVRLRDIYCRCFIDNLNISMFTNLSGGNSGYEYMGLIACNNVLGITGNWQCNNWNWYAQSWNVHRVGGGEACLKMFKNGASSQHIQYIPLVIGPDMLKSLEWTPGSTGQHTATLHIAYKNVTDADGYFKYFKAIVEVPDDDGSEILGRQDYVFSPVSGQWQDDSASTWQNDSGLTRKKLVIPFNVSRTDLPVTVRVQFNWWDSLGNFVFYFDPIVEFS